MAIEKSHSRVPSGRGLKKPSPIYTPLSDGTSTDACADLDIRQNHLKEY